MHSNTKSPDIAAHRPPTLIANPTSRYLVCVLLGLCCTWQSCISPCLWLPFFASSLACRASRKSCRRAAGVSAVVASESIIVIMLREAAASRRCLCASSSCRCRLPASTCRGMDKVAGRTRRGRTGGMVTYLQPQTHCTAIAMQQHIKHQVRMSGGRSMYALVVHLCLYAGHCSSQEHLGRLVVTSTVALSASLFLRRGVGWVATNLPYATHQPSTLARYASCCGDDGH